MREFNIEEAKAGKKVCTRDGCDARILCFDLIDEHYPIVAAIYNEDTKDEDLLCYSKSGQFNEEFQSDKDLMMDTWEE